jgi:osmotically-inducible protein OsmY
MKLVPTLITLLSALMLAAAAHADKSAGQVVDDNTINATVKSELIGSKETKARSINVETYKGVVQLSGFVPTDAMREKAGVVALRVEGVKKLDNVLQVRPE